MMRLIIERVEIRRGKNGRDELFYAFKQMGRERTAIKQILAFRQIPEFIDEFKKDNSAEEIVVDFFDSSYEFLRDFEEDLERFL